MCSIATFAQQEIDPDHFDSPSAVTAHVKKPANARKPASQHSANVKVAAKHSHQARHQHA